MLKRLLAPKLFHWAAHTNDIAAVAERLRKAGVAFSGPTPGSRARPDGKMLHWQTLNMENDQNGLIPFFIEWGKDTTHPSTDAPQGCRLESFGALSGVHTFLTTEYRKLGLEVNVEIGSPARLQARIQGPNDMLARG